MTEKIITIEDCLNLQKQLKKYCDSAEQHEFPLLYITDTMLNRSLEEMQKTGKIENQNEARAMFRVVLTLMGLDYSEYIDEQYLKNKRII